MDTAFIERIRASLRKLERQRADLDARIEGFHQVLRHYDENPEEQLREWSSSEIKEHMAEILEERGAPTHYREIFEALTERGVHIGGAEPARNVGALLSGDARFESIGRGNWILEAWNNRRPKRPLAPDQSPPQAPRAQTIEPDDIVTELKASDEDSWLSDEELDDVPF